MSRTSFELTRGRIVMHVIPTPSGGFTGDDVYDSKKKGLQFRNFHHMQAFAKKFNYTVAPISNT